MRNSLIDSVENKTQLVPELRFPEFENEKGWKIQSIDELCEILNNIRKPITSSNRISGEYPYYGASGIIDYVDEYLFNEQLLLVGEDGAKWGAFENTAFLVKGKYWVNNHAHVLRPKRIDDKLLESYLIKLDLNPYITGAAPPKLTLGKLKGILVPTPVNPVEQQKIASCLSSLDELITANREKLEALQAHKKGLMQNLFPQEGQTVPNYRFPEFEDDGEWEEEKLEKIATFLSGGTPSKSEETYWNGTIPWISASSMHKLEIWDSELKITEHAIKAGTRLVEEGTILILVRGSMLFNKVPICVTMKPVSFNQDVKALILKEHYNKQFILYNLLAHENNIPIDKTGIGAGKIGSEELKGLTLFIPKSEKEQQKIAACLTEVDKLITAQTEKIDRLLHHKKGLMQGLFPNNLD